MERQARLAGDAGSRSAALPLYQHAERAAEQWNTSAQRWLRIRVVTEVEEVFVRSVAGVPGRTPNTVARSGGRTTELDEDGAAVAADALADGCSALVTNDEPASGEALAKYKYQPFVEKRHEDNSKSVFRVAPVWLKSPRRIASLLWLYFVVELIQALVEREVRQQMRAGPTATEPVSGGPSE